MGDVPERYELPHNVPLIYPEAVTVNRLEIMNIAGSEPTILLAFEGVLETDPNRPFEENPRGQIGVAIHPNVVAQMIPLIVACLTWQHGQPDPGGTMVLRHLTDEEMEAQSDGIRQGRGDQPAGEGRGEGEGEGGAAGADPDLGGGPQAGGAPGGSGVPGGDGAGVAGGDVAAAGRDEVAPVPAPADVNGCIHPAQMVIRAHDPKSGELKRVYCGVCGLEFD